jgi:exonuclease III
MYVSILTYNTRGLPWVKDQSVGICSWLIRRRPGLLCLQEVFLPTTRAYYKEQLERVGYRVYVPSDEGVTLVNSGLLTAILVSEYTGISDCFYPYLTYHNVEIFANKGFYVTWIMHRASGRRLYLVNTHMQSDTEITWFLGRHGTYAVRKAQHQQLVDTLKNTKDPVVLVGDLNSEHSPLSSVRYMSLVDDSRLQKATFYSTGENLDHCAWFPLEWAHSDEIKGCAFCDFNHRGPRLTQCQIYQVPWSDHAPVIFSLVVPFDLWKPRNAGLTRLAATA